MYLCLVWASPASKTQLIFKSSRPYFSPSAFIFCIFWYFSVFVWPNMGQPFKKQKKLRCQGAPLRVLRKWPRPVVETIGPNSLDLNNPKLGSRVSVVESLHRWRRPCWYPCIPWSMWKMSIANYRLIMTDRMFLVYRFGYSKLHQVHPNRSMCQSRGLGRPAVESRHWSIDLDHWMSHVCIHKRTRSLWYFKKWYEYMTSWGNTRIKGYTAIEELHAYTVS